MRGNTSTQLYLEISPARNPRSPFPWPRPCYCHPRKETRHSSNARTLQRRCSLPKDTTVLKVIFHVQCTSTPEFPFKQSTVTNGYSNCRYNIFGDRIKQWTFFRFVSFTGTQEKWPLNGAGDEAAVLGNSTFLISSIGFWSSGKVCSKKTKKA